MKHSLKHRETSWNTLQTPFDAAISVLARSFWQYRHGVSSDCDVVITLQMCNRARYKKHSLLRNKYFREDSRIHYLSWKSLNMHHECQNIKECNIYPERFSISSVLASEPSLLCCQLISDCGGEWMCRLSSLS